MPADWPYRAIPSVTSAYRCISVTVWSLPQRYFSYRHVITFGIPVNVFLFLSPLPPSFSPSCVSDRPNSSLKHDDWAPVNHFAFFVQVAFVVVILHTGNWPGPALAVSAHFSRFAPVQLWPGPSRPQMCKLSILGHGVGLAHNGCPISTPRKKHLHTNGELLSGPMPQCAIVSIIKRESPLPCAHTPRTTPHHISSAAQTSQDDR